MKHLFAFLALVLLASTAHGQPAPPSGVVVITCRAQVQTSFEDYQRPIEGMTYWELALNRDNEYECQRLFYEDQMDAMTGVPLDASPNITDASNINFSNYSRCARVAPFFAMEADKSNQGWLSVAVGCPTPIFDDNGTPQYGADDRIVDWKLPGCPVYLPGTSNRMTCRFDKSQV